MRIRPGCGRLRLRGIDELRGRGLGQRQRQERPRLIALRGGVHQALAEGGEIGAGVSLRPADRRAGEA
jgi:hypothetical protein